MLVFGINVSVCSQSSSGEFSKILNCSSTWMTTGSTPSTSSYCLHHYLRHSPPVSHLRLQTHDLCRQPVDLLLRPDDVTEVHLIAVEALMGP